MSPRWRLVWSRRTVTDALLAAIGGGGMGMIFGQTGSYIGAVVGFLVGAYASTNPETRRQSIEADMARLEGERKKCEDETKDGGPRP